MGFLLVSYQLTTAYDNLDKTIQGVENILSRFDFASELGMKIHNGSVSHLPLIISPSMWGVWMWIV